MKRASVNHRPAVVVLGLGQFGRLDQFGLDLGRVDAGEEGQCGRVSVGAGVGGGGVHGRMVRADRAQRNPSEGGTGNNEATKR